MPGAADNVVVDLAGTYTITISTNEAAGSLRINDANATLSVENAEQLTVEGSIVNQGAISLASVGNDTRLVVNGGTVSLSGGGTVSLANQDHALIVAGGAGDMLDNIDNTILGTGRLGNGGALELINEAGGTIDANSTAGALVINTGAVSLVNKGLIEATGGGALVVQTVIGNSGGTIAAAGGSMTIAAGAAVSGFGTLSGSIDNEGAIEASGGTLDIAGTVTGGGSEQLDATGTLELAAGGSVPGAIVFAGSGGMLRIDGTTMPGNTISGFAAGDTIDLPNVGANSISYAGGIVTLLNGTATVAQLSVATPYANPAFTEARDNTGGTVITVAPPPAANYTVVTNFAKSSLIQTKLIKEFPSGIVTGNTGLTVPFDIVSDASGHNYYDAGGTLTINVAIPNVTHAP